MGEAILSKEAKSLNTITATLTTSGWTQNMADGSKYQTVNVPGSTAKNIKFVDAKLTKANINEEADILEAWARVNYGDDSVAGKITFWCYGKKPEKDIPVMVVIAP